MWRHKPEKDSVKATGIVAMLGGSAVSMMMLIAYKTSEAADPTSGTVLAERAAIIGGAVVAVLGVMTMAAAEVPTHLQQRRERMVFDPLVNDPAFSADIANVFDDFRQSTEGSE